MQFNIFNKEETTYKTNKKGLSLKNKITILIILFFIGFIFFLTSNIWYVTSNDFTSNNIYDTISLTNNVNLKLRRWSFNPNTKKSEIEIGKNFSLAKNDFNFKLTVLSNGNNYINSKVLYDNENLWVIELEKLPLGSKYVELKFTTTIDNEILEASFFMDLKSKEMEIDENLDFSNRNENYYIQKSISYEITMLQKTLNKNNKIISDSKNQITSYQSDLSEIQVNEQNNYTKDELELINTKINNINTEIKNLNNLIEQKTEENKSLESDIKVLQSKLDEK